MKQIVYQCLYVNGKKKREIFCLYSWLETNLLQFPRAFITMSRLIVSDIRYLDSKKYVDNTGGTGFWQS